MKFMGATFSMFETTGHFETNGLLIPIVFVPELCWPYWALLRATDLLFIFILVAFY